jgi:hypothetical protein
VAAKQVEELTRDDALTVACDMAPMVIWMSRGKHLLAAVIEFFCYVRVNRILRLITNCAGIPKICAGAGMDEMAMLMSFALYPFSAQTASPLPEDYTKALARHLLTIGTDAQVSELVRAGAWMSMIFMLQGRPQTTTALYDNGGVFKTVASILHCSSPTEWISWRTPAGNLAGAALGLLPNIMASLLPAPTSESKVQAFVDSGVMDIAISAMQVRSRPST